MRGRLPLGLDRLRRAIDHRHGRFPPEADIQPLALGRGECGVGAASLRQGDKPRFLPMLQRQGRQAVAQAARRVEPLAIVAARQAGGHLQYLFLWDIDDFAVREVAIGKVELVDNVVFAAADQQLFSVGCEGETVECPWQRDARHDALRLQIDDDDFVRSIAGMQDRGPIALGCNGHVDREIPQFDLPAGRPQRPLVRQEYGAVVLRSRQRTKQRPRVGRRFLGGKQTCSQNWGSESS